MKIILEKKLEKEIQKATRAMGLDTEEFTNRALQFYLAAVGQEIALQQELRAWDQVSDEALIAMEQQLGTLL